MTTDATWEIHEGPRQQPWLRHRRTRTEYTINDGKLRVVLGAGGCWTSDVPLYLVGRLMRAHTLWLARE